MNELGMVRRIAVPKDEASRRELLNREWLVTNGMGGYASGTLAGGVSRRYHGLLVAALPAPLGRTVMFNHIAETVRLQDGQQGTLFSNDDSLSQPLVEIRQDHHLPIWSYRFGNALIEKRVFLVSGQNTVHITYELVEGEETIEIELLPSFQFRAHESEVSQGESDYWIEIHGRFYEIHNRQGFPPLKLMLRADQGHFLYDGGMQREVIYVLEAERGYPSRGALWSPGRFQTILCRQKPIELVASTESWDTMQALQPQVARALEIDRRRHFLKLAGGDRLDAVGADLVLAADQFIITPAGRIEDAARAHAAGDQIRTIIAGYHWFTDWGRDTMISLEGLTLSTGRFHEASWILRTFAHYVRDGLIPNLFPEGKNEGLYHTADATLWFFHALDRYVSITGDREMVVRIMPKLLEIIKAHEHGTRFGIGVDPSDGLLKQGEEGYQLTWMDAKVGDWVVTPRRGKAVEINALWYHALCLMEEWLNAGKERAIAREISDKAKRVQDTFNRRFWNDAAGFLYDVVDGESGNDPACRPNQIFSVSLGHPVLAAEKWPLIVRTVKDHLLTPFGLRTLSADHPDFKPRYYGDLRARDAAYHQGTVWAWLIGPFIDAWLRVNPNDLDGARNFLNPLGEHLNEASISSISEIFDAEPPYRPRGCIAQAWSVAETVRCWLKTAR